VTKKSEKAAPKRHTDLVCDRCGAHSKAGTKECVSCGSERFSPTWVREMRRVNRNFSVQVNDPHPASESKQPRLTFYKWWPGANASFNVNTSAQWEDMKRIVDTELAQFLGWYTREQIAETLASIEESNKESSGKVTTLVASHPELLTQIVAGIDLGKISDEDVPELARALSSVTSVFISVDEKLRTSISRLVKKLPKEGAKAISQLEDLMETLTLGQISAVATEVQRRVGLLDTFSERVLDDKTYEIRGDGSIHRLLEQAMWIVDERYWLMHSNKQLRTVIGKELAKKDKKYETKRPDFVCGTVDGRLIIIEIKRPSHKLTVEDLNQLEQYVALADEYDGSHKGFEAILVGQKPSPELDRILKIRGGTRFKVMTYTQLVSDAKRRYKSYLDELQK